MYYVGGLNNYTAFSCISLVFTRKIFQLNRIKSRETIKFTKSFEAIGKNCIVPKGKHLLTIASNLITKFLVLNSYMATTKKRRSG